MASPLAPLATATLVFQQPDAAPLVVVAYLKKLSRNSLTVGSGDIPAGEETAQQLTGYMIAPLTMPPAIQGEQVAEITLWRTGLVGHTFKLPATGFPSATEYAAFVIANADKIRLQGDFHWQPGMATGAGEDTIIGDKLQGKLTLRSLWVDAI